MSYNPSSTILFLAICSLNKAHGGEPAYNEQDSITVSLKPETSAKFLHRREQVRQRIFSISRGKSKQHPTTRPAQVTWPVQ